MADPILRSKITFGNSDRIEAALQEGLIDQFDVVCLDGETDPKIGWIDRDGNTRIVKNQDVILVKGDALPEVGEEEVIYIFKSTLYYWNGTEFVASVCDNGVSEADMNAKIDSALEAYSANKYEITDAPEGTLVNYGEHEIRILIPANATFTKQAVGEGGDPNSYYVTLKTYFTDDEIMGYREHLGDQVDEEILKDIKTDVNGRRYQPSWLAVAKYDEATNTWNYYGASSSENKYIGWDYRLDQYNVDDVMIASDFVRINLSNEDCHFSLAPSYLNGVVTEANAYTDKKIAEVASGYEIVEF